MFLKYWLKLDSIWIENEVLLPAVGKALIQSTKVILVHPK